MAKRYHITPEGPKRCGVDESNPRSPGCRYGLGGHYADSASAAQAFEEKMGGAAPASLTKSSLSIPDRFYHITARSNLDSIAANGLQPSIGERSEDLGESEDKVYLFDSMESVESALGGWLGEELDEDEEYVLLSVKAESVHGAEPSFEEENGENSWEWTTNGSISSVLLEVEEYEI